MNVQDICKAIGELKSEEELKAVNDVLRVRWGGLKADRALEARLHLRQGDRVTFNRSSTGVLMEGTLTKINTTRGKVKVDWPGGQSQVWTVPLSMLHKVA